MAFENLLAEQFLSLFTFIFVNVCCNAWEICLFDTKLRFCHFQEISALKSSSIAIARRVISSINKIN